MFWLKLIRLKELMSFVKWENSKGITRTGGKHTRQGLEVASTTITWYNFKKEFSDKYFSTDVRNRK